MRGTVCMVTGANRGMGYAITKALAQQGATVVMVCRDQARGQQARDEIAAATGSAAIDLLVADLASLQAIRALARAFQQRHARLHVLVNNAGAHVQQRQLSPDGIEMNLAVNHLSSFLLTHLLLDTLRASAPARIINVASNAMARALDLEDLQSERAFDPWHAYGRAKLAMVLSTYALARRLQGSGVTVNALHPGIVATDIIDGVAPALARPFVGLLKAFLQTPEQGARTAVYLASAPELAGVSGQYFVKGRVGRSVPCSYDTALQEEVWGISAALAGLTGGVPLQRP